MMVMGKERERERVRERVKEGVMRILKEMKHAGKLFVS